MFIDVVTEWNIFGFSWFLVNEMKFPDDFFCFVSKNFFRTFHNKISTVYSPSLLPLKVSFFSVLPWWQNLLPSYPELTPCQLTSTSTAKNIAKQSTAQMVGESWDVFIKWVRLKNTLAVSCMKTQGGPRPPLSAYAMTFLIFWKRISHNVGESTE